MHMKLGLQIAKITICLVALNFTPAQNAKGQSANRDQKIITQLKEFYKSYITENSKMRTDLSKVNALKKANCTVRLLKDIKGLDYDPFLNAQDCSEDWLGTLSVEKHPKNDGQFIVSYVDGYSNKRIEIILIIVEDSGHFRIDSIK